MVVWMLAGSTVLPNTRNRSRTARDTSTAFSPVFLVTVMVSAGWTLPAAAIGAPSALACVGAPPGVNQT